MVRKYNNGKWTEGRFKAFITSTLRSGTRRWPPKHAVLASAKTERKINPATGRLAQMYECKACKAEFSSRDIQVDHIEAVTSPTEGFTSWDVFIDRLYCEQENLQVLCVKCHKKKTMKETTQRALNRTPTYQCWLDMKGRCYNKNNQRYHTHGARGITVCEEWRKNYQSFLTDMGEKPDGKTLDRIDNNGNYTPTNCRWATPKEQANNRSTCIYVEYNGKTQTIAQWAEELGLTFSSLIKRLRNWSLEDAMNPKKRCSVKISEDVKDEILELYKSGNLSQATLANIYGVSQAVISKWVVALNKKEINEN